jgi:aryl-phospho-beta-D-glucosidase BglC (GH1 family)
MTINQTGDVNYLQLRGVNFQSANIAYQSLPAISRSNYLFPNSVDINYIVSKGANFCRIVFGWEALQPTLGGSISNPCSKW